MLRAKQRFDDAVIRIKTLDSIYVHLTTNMHFPEDDVSDILRSEIIYIVSALDKFIHDIVRQGMSDIYLGLRTETPTYKNFSITLDQMNLINNSTTFPAPVDVFESIVVNNHKHLSFQDPDKITPALSLIWSENHKWQKIASCLGLPENDVKIELKNIVIRRNQIAHEGDIDLLTNLPQPILHSDVVKSVTFIENLVNCIFASI